MFGVMKITDELYEIGKNGNGIFTDVNDDYCLVSKSMPVNDQELEKYISAITKAKSDGINIASIVDYRMIPGTTATYNTNHGVITYTRGVFLEDKAKGKSLGIKNLMVSPNNQYDFDKLTLDYLRLILDYIEELERRLEAPQETFDKLVSDCLDLEDYGLTIDPKPLNFFYHPKHGFTIIDVIGLTDKDKRLSENDYFPTYIYGIVLGYGPSTLSIGNDKYTGLPIEYQTRMFNALNGLEIKIKTALFNNGIKMDTINENANRNGYRFVNAYTNVELEDMVTEVVDKTRSYQHSKQETSIKKTFDIDEWI